MENSILNTIKKLIGFDPLYTHFDLDIIVQINSCFSTLHDLGVGPVEGFFITDDKVTWDEYEISEPYLGMVKTYVYINTKLLFDRPETSYAIQAMTKAASELEWRLHAESEMIRNASRTSRS